MRTPPLSALILTLIYGKPIARTIQEHTTTIAANIIDTGLRLKHGENPTHILQSQAQEAATERYEHLHRKATTYEMRAIRYAELHEFDAADLMQTKAQDLRDEANNQDT